MEEGKLYQIICAFYSGEKTEMSLAECLLGRINIDKNTALLGILADKVIKRIKVKIEGKRSAGLDVKEEEQCLEELLQIKEKTNGKR